MKRFTKINRSVKIVCGTPVIPTCTTHTHHHTDNTRSRGGSRTHRVEEALQNVKRLVSRNDDGNHTNGNTLICLYPQQRRRAPTRRGPPATPAQPQQPSMSPKPETKA